MKHPWSTYRKLFTSTLTLSAFTFGGGYVIVPLMKQKFVDDLQWIEEQDMLNLTAIAQAAPGPIAVNTSILLGYRVAGLPGAAVTILGTVLPPLVILSVISLFYAAFRSNHYVAALLRGMQSGVAAVICSVVFDMGFHVVKDRDALAILIMALAFIAVLFFKINVVWIILSCAALGIFATLLRKRRGGSR